MVDYERALDDLGFRHAEEGASRRLGLARRRRRFALGPAAAMEAAAAWG